MTVRDRLDDFLAEPFAEFDHPFLMAGWAEKTTCQARQHAEGNLHVTHDQLSHQAQKSNAHLSKRKLIPQHRIQDRDALNVQVADAVHDVDHKGGKASG
jgi:hypothetical protein